MRFRDDEGFTLIEAVVSIAIFAIVATAATFAIVSSTRAASATELRVAAGHIADAELDRLVQLGPDIGETPAERIVTNDEHRYVVTVKATPAYEEACTDGGTRDVQVTVTTNASGSSQVSTELYTRLACTRRGIG